MVISRIIDRSVKEGSRHFSAAGSVQLSLLFITYNQIKYIYIYLYIYKRKKTMIIDYNLLTSANLCLNHTESISSCWITKVKQR